RRQIEPGDRVEDYEEQADEIQNEYGRAFRPGLELLIVFRTLAQGANLQEGEDDEPDDKEAAQLAQDESEIRPSLHPPVGRDPRSVPAGVIFGVSRYLAHGAPRGRRKDLNHSSAAFSLERWMGPPCAT